MLSLHTPYPFLCKGKGLFSESAPIPLHPLTLKTPHIPLPPYSLRGRFVITDTLFCHCGRL